MIPILMDSTKTLTALAADQTNGLGALSECTSCIAKEERNGSFTLELKLPQNAKHFSEVTVGGVIKAKAREAGDPQLFRISKITKPMQGVVTVYANHISYDLNKTSVLPFSSTGIVTTLSTMKTKMQGGDAFTLSTDIVNTSSSFSNKVPQSARALFGGQQGSLLDVFGGEYLFDNLQVSLLANRGNDNGVTLRYGKNITDLSQEENIENTYTAIQPYVVDSNENAVLGDLLTVVQSAEPKIMNLDLSNKFSGDDTPTVAQINAAAQQYAEANNIGVPKVSIKVSFVALWQTEEYKDIAPLERVSLCDTVTVVFEKLGVNAKAKVISTTYDTLRERYTEIEIGDARSTLASTISGISQDNKNAVASASGFLDNTIQQLTSLMANGLGLFVTKEEVGETGGYKYYLHNRPTLADSQYQWTFNSNGFAVSQDYGATWTAGIDADGNAVFNSLSANTIKAMNIYGSIINGSRFESANGLFYLSIWAGVFKMLYNDLYVRGTLFQTQGSGNIVLMGGSSTDTNVNPSDDYALRMNKRSMFFYRNNDTTNFPYFYFWDTDVFGLYRGNSKIELYADGKIGIYRDNSKIEIGNDGGVSVTNGTKSIGINGTSGDIFVQNRNSYLSIDNSGKLSVNVKSLDVFINGNGYKNLGFVNDGNGHAVLGK